MARLRARARGASRAFEHVRSLTDDVGPRLAGSEGDRRAVAWAVRTMTALGLANVRAEPVTVPHWERVAESGEITAPVPQRVTLTALGGSVSTPEGGLEAEVTEFASLAALEAAAPASLAGRIAFVYQPIPRRRDGAGYGQGVPARVRGAIAAARAGAVGLVMRSVGTDTDRFAHTGYMRYEPAPAPRVPAAALAVPDADLVHRLITANPGTPVRLRMTLTTRELPGAPSANVIGEVPGTDRAREVVLLGAHLDSWDLGRGALDDGAGCAIVLEAARLVAAAGAVRPRRTVRVVLFANEENGGAGAEAYARDHAAELPAHVLALEADAGDGRVYAMRTPSALRARPAFALLAEQLAPLGVAWDARESSHGGADVSDLARAGVPLVDLRQDMSRYFDVHHTANDTLDRVVRAELDRAVAAFATAAYAAAVIPEEFGRVAP